MVRAAKKAVRRALLKCILEIDYNSAGSEPFYTVVGPLNKMRVRIDVYTSKSPIT